ncbi:MAG: FKBP-type peptidyl-prolyl cis-trans isomerase [Cyclobacteriaceae bacterium]|nr:FKBP-type peptidyl-prolyl cis-trans isomerase [Cyclobacteriaceae bacterium HetDA_MAG_MS6]
MKKNLFPASLLLLGVLVSCLDTDDEVFDINEQLTIDSTLIADYLADNNITAATHDPSGVRYVIHEAGSGDSVQITDVITANYEGRFLSNDQVFDSGEDVSFPLNQTIIGWQIGIPLIRQGGRITLYIPSPWAYGPRGRSTIPPNAVLIFDVELRDIL